MNSAECVMVRNADVKVSEVYDSGNHKCAAISINGDEFKHIFPHTSRISTAVRMSRTPKDVEQHLTGGSFFFVNEQLIDFRDGNYNGFVHDDDSIRSLVETIGITPIDSSKKHKLGLNTQSNEIGLLRDWSTQDFNIANLQEGGNFQTTLAYNWNPFFHYVKSAFSVERLVCTNGMVATTRLLNTNIPLINRWQEHLDIANIQLQNKMNSLLVKRLDQMQLRRATISMLLRIQQHAIKRAEDTTRGDEHRRLRNISRIADPALFLENVYDDEVFANQNLAAQLDGHLTEFDAWNLATEMLSHTASTETSTTRGVQIIANSLIFPVNNENTKRVNYNTPDVPLSPFSDPERAYFGFQEV